MIDYHIEALVLYIGIFFCIFVLPFVLTVLNLFFLIRVPDKAWERSLWFASSAATIIIGYIDSFLYGCVYEISLKDWYEPVIRGSTHTPVSLEHLLTVCVFALIGGLGYLILLYRPIDKTPPLVFVLLISMIYFGVVISVLWAVQTSDIDSNLYSIPFFAIYSLNLCICAASLIRKKIKEYREMNDSGRRITNPKFAALDKLLSKSSMWPVYAFVLFWPLAGIVICILMMQGQSYDSIIKAWTETSDWVLSTKQSPPPVEPDGHYLCTVSAGGHKKLVKPIRQGERHGHRVIVNRQLCIANAFEQVIEEKTPHFHKAVRSFYDKYGFPVAKLIRTPLAADCVYIIMKPLEWLFVIVLYLTDVNPEKRIAVQYLPKNERESLLEYIDHAVIDRESV